MSVHPTTDSQTPFFLTVFEMAFFSGRKNHLTVIFFCINYALLQRKLSSGTQAILYDCPFPSRVSCDLNISSADVRLVSKKGLYNKWSTLKSLFLFCL